jgi:hypothetical protein
MNSLISNRELITLALGILAGLFWSRRIGFGVGGIITPGLLALYLETPLRPLLCLALGALLSPLLAVLSRVFDLYGRERTGAAMLLSLSAGALLSLFFPAQVFWVGYVIPGLIAADCERQGVITVSGAAASALAAFFAATLLSSFWAFL